MALLGNSSELPTEDGTTSADQVLCEMRACQRMDHLQECKQSAAALAAQVVTFFTADGIVQLPSYGRRRAFSQVILAKHCCNGQRPLEVTQRSFCLVSEAS